MNRHLGFRLIDLSSPSHLQAVELVLERKSHSDHDRDPWSSLNGLPLVEAQLDRSRGELLHLCPSRWRCAVMILCYLVARQM